MQSFTSKPALVLQGSLALGLSGGVLLDGTAWDVTVLLLAVAGAIALVGVRAGAGEPTSSRDVAVIALVLAWGSVPALRDSATLRVLAALALGATLYLTYLGAACNGLVAVPLASAGGTVPAALRHLLCGASRLLRQDVDWRATRASGATASIGQVGRGLALATPLVLVFGMLLVSADARFERLAVWAFDWDLAKAVRHAATFVTSFWIAAAMLRASVLRRGIDRREACVASLRAGGVEVATMLLVLDLLFTAYVLVQFTYFFGGESIVRETDSLTYAAYARRGFFELVVLAALVIPILTLAHWLVRDARPGVRRACRVLAVVMVALVVLIELSAAHRMALYARAYGLTELRLYTSAFMVWLLLLFAWLTATVLRDRRERFTFGAAASALALIGALVALNPDASIARSNIARAATGATLDVHYLLSLSDDATPTITRLLPTLRPGERNVVAGALAERMHDSAERGWRSWSLAGHRARAAVAEVLAGQGG